MNFDDSMSISDLEAELKHLQAAIDRDERRSLILIYAMSAITAVIVLAAIFC